MASQADVPILMRKWDGVNIADEAVFIGTSFLQKADNWLPDVNYRLAKRPGTAIYYSLPNIVRIDRMLRTYDTDGNRYLFALGIDAAGIGHLFVNVNDGVPSQVGPDFIAPFARYGMAALGTSVYVGNGVGFIRRIDLPALTSTFLGPLPLLVDTGQTANPVADPTTLLDTGTYSYVWAVYDNSTKHWVSVGNSTGDMVHTITLSATAGASQSLTFTAPTTALPANQKYHLFVTLPDGPIETAHDQAPEGLNASDSLTLRTIVFTSTPVPIAEVGRRGNILVAQRSALWFAGDTTKPSRVFSSAAILPALAQEIFDIGDFFPWDAEEPIGEGDGDIITGLVVAALTSTQQSPISPMAIFKQNSTWLFLGDLFDDPSSSLVQISGKVGCIAPNTAVATRWGVVFCGRDSVYLLPASLTEPLDIGWPIAPAIRSIPPDAAPNAFAFYQNGFYCLSIAASGQLENRVLWMLDMRRGPGAPRGQGPVPSWWGPHSVQPMTAAAVGTQDPQRVDRTFLALLNTSTTGENELWNSALWNSALWSATATIGVIVENEQPTETDVVVGGTPTPIVSVFKSAGLDNGDPYGRKLFQRMRSRGRADHTTQFEVCLLVDELPEECRTGQLPGGGSALWNSALWNSALWGGMGFLAVISDVTTPLDPDLSPPQFDGLVFGTQNATDPAGPAGRATGYQAEIVITHRQPVAVTLRDVELRYLPHPRPIP